MLQPPEWVSENVKAFPVRETLGRFLSDLYVIETVNVEAVNYGTPVGRLRSYTVGKHKMKSALIPRPLASSLENFFQKVLRPCEFGWDHLWWVHQQGSILWDNEVETELKWACGRPSVEKSFDMLMAMDEHDRWFAALTPTEQNNANVYQLKWPGQAYSLTQSAMEHPTLSTPRYLQTFIHNFGLLWTWRTNPPRWLSASEALVGMGVPVMPELRRLPDWKPSGYLISSFDVQKAHRKPQTIRSQCGNSDSVVLAAITELYSLMNTETLGCNLTTQNKTLVNLLTNNIVNKNHTLSLHTVWHWSMNLND